MGIVRACQRQIAKLDAEESLDEVHRVAVGTATFDKETRAEVMAIWTSDANGGTTPASRPAPKPTRGDLSAMGTAVTTVKRRR